MAIEPIRLGQTQADFYKKFNEVIAAVNALTGASITADAVAANPVGGGEAETVQGILEELDARLTAIEGGGEG